MGFGKLLASCWIIYYFRRGVLRYSKKAGVRAETSTFGFEVKVVPWRKRGFEEVFLEAVDEALSLLGFSAKQAIYYHLEVGFNLKRHEIPRRVEDFADAIEAIFGPGARLIEIKIMEKLYRKTGKKFRFKPKDEDFTFTEYVKVFEEAYKKRRAR